MRNKSDCRVTVVNIVIVRGDLRHVLRSLRKGFR